MCAAVGKFTYGEQFDFYGDNIGRRIAEHEAGSSATTLTSDEYGSGLYSTVLPLLQYQRGERRFYSGHAPNSDLRPTQLTKNSPYTRSFNLIPLEPVVRKDSSPFASAMAAASVVIYNYRNKVLELRTPQTYKQLSKAYKNARHRFIGYMALAGGHLGTWWLEACMMGYYLSQHRVLVLYEFEGRQRKINARQSFHGDVCCARTYPDGDMLVFPRMTPKCANIYIDCIFDICTTLQAIHHLAGNYRVKINPILPTEEDICLHRMSNVFRTEEELMISRMFKPVFFPVYFEVDDPCDCDPKTIMALNMFEKCCLAFEHVCEAAIAWCQIGYSLAAAQAATICTQYMDMLLGTPTLTDRKCYSHLMADWQLGQVAFMLFCEMDETERNIVAYRHFDRMTTELPNFTTTLETFDDFFPEETLKIRKQYPWRFPSDKRACLEMGVSALRRCNLPNSWTCSLFKLFFMSTFLQLHNLRHWAAGITQYTDSFSYEELLRRLEDIVETAAVARGHIPCVAPGDPMGLVKDVAVLQRLVTARALRYKVMFLAAWEHPAEPSCSSMEQLFSSAATTREGRLRRRKTFRLSFLMSPEQIEVAKKVLEEQQKGIAILRALSDNNTKYWHCVHNLSLVAHAFEVYIQEVDYLNRSPLNKIEECQRIIEVIRSLGHLFSACDVGCPKEYLRRVNHEKQEALYAVLALHCSALSRIFLHWSKRLKPTHIGESYFHLRTARYYSFLASLCHARLGVAQYLLQQHCTKLQLTRAAFLNRQCTTPVDAAKRLCLLRDLVEALPFLWDFYIMHGPRRPCNYMSICVESKVLPVTESEIKKLYSPPCTKGLMSALISMANLPKSQMPRDTNAEKQMSAAENKAIHEACDLIFKATTRRGEIGYLSETEFRKLNLPILDIVEKFLFDDEKIIHTKILCTRRAISEVFRFLCKQVRNQEIPLRQSTVRIAVIILSISFGVLGTYSSGYIEFETPENIRDKLAEIMQDVCSLMREPSLEDQPERVTHVDIFTSSHAISVGSHIVPSTSLSSKFSNSPSNESKTVKVPDFVDFLHWVDRMKQQGRSGQYENPIMVQKYFNRSLRPLLEQTEATLQVPNSSNNYLFADSLCVFLCECEKYIQNQTTALATISSLTKVFFKSLKDTLEYNFEARDWCASGEEVHSHTSLRDFVASGDSWYQIDKFDEMVRCGFHLDDNKIHTANFCLGAECSRREKTPNYSDGLKLAYNPFECMPSYVREEELKCMRFEQFSITRGFYEATGDFTCEKQSKNCVDLLKALKSQVSSVIDATVVDLTALRERQDADFCFLDTLGKSLDVTAYSLAALERARNLLKVEIEAELPYVLAKSIAIVDEVIFKKSVRVLLRGDVEEKPL